MSDETNNQSVERSPTAAHAKTSGGVFSWLTGSRSPSHGTGRDAIEITTTTASTTVRSNASGSPNASGSVSPARTASPVGSSGSRASGLRSPSRSPPRSPARRFEVPQVAMAGGGRFGPAVMFDMGRRTVYVQSDDEETADEGTMAASTITSTSEEMKLPPSVQITTKTVGGEATENQVPEPPLTVRYATIATASRASEDNQVEPGEHVQYITKTAVAGEPAATTTVHYVTKTVEAGDNQIKTEELPAGTVQYVTTTTSADATLAQPPPASPSGQGGVRSVRYVTKTVASPAHATTTVSPGGVRYMTKTMAVDGGQRLLSPATPSPVGHSGTTNTRFFGSPQTTQHQQPNVHYVTRIVNGQSVQVPVPVGVPPSHEHRVQYVTTTSPGGAVKSSVSPSSSVSSTTAATPSEHQHQHQHQHVRYIVKSATPQQSVQPGQVQYVTTRTVSESGAASPAGSASSVERTAQSVPLSAVVASTVAGQNGTGSVALSQAHHVPASLFRLDSTTEGLPSRQFRGVALTDTDSSDSEDGEVKMVFDIMLQKFVPVKKARRRSSGAAAAAAAATAGVAGAVAVTATPTGAAASEAIAGAKIEMEQEEKAAIPMTAVAAGGAVAVVDEKKNQDSGLAMGAAIGLTAAGAVGAAAAAAAAGTTTTPSPRKKLDTVATHSAATAGTGSPSALKKRTPSQTKREPSPRKFFASAAANEAPILPDQDVTLDMDASPSQYAELRSPSNNDMPDGSRLGHIGMSLKVRVCRWLLITLLSLAIIVFLMVLFYKGVALRKFQASDYSYAKQYDMLDNYNSYVGLVASLFSKPIELLVGIVVPILFFSFMAKALLGNKLSPRLLTVMFSLSSILGFLLTNGFHGINVQMRVKGVEPVIALSDLSLQLSAAAALSALVAANASSNASMIVAEGGAGNAVTNTVLRTVIATAVDDAQGEAATAAPARRALTASTAGRAHRALAESTTSPLLCSNTADYTNLLGTSELGSLTTLSTTTVATFGFPMRAWQEQMLPGALPETNVTITLDGKPPVVGSVSALPMRVRTAANLFLHSAHIARDVFHWFGEDSKPLGVENTVNTKYSTAKSDGGLTYVSVAELMNLTVSGNLAEETLAAPAFLSQVRTLFNQSLAGAVNISRSESSLEFTSVTLPNGYAFESVTMEIPLAKNFLSRRLSSVGSVFAEDTSPTAANETDVFYDLDIANDCGPYAGACEVRRTEYDADGRVYEPPTTIRAFALCNSSRGDSELEVFFDESQATKTIAYACNGKSDDGMLVVSVSSRIVGDAMIEGPSPLVPRLVAGMATLQNPRKIYSLTVGKLSWPKTNLALKFHAACAAGVGKCTGLDYALTAALENATTTFMNVASGSLRGVLTTTLEEERNKEHEYLIVGGDFLPLKLVPTFVYNQTEAATTASTTTANSAKKTVSGYPLLTITKPLEGDSLFQNDGDVALGANFKNVNWTSTTPRTGASCSATVEARLNSVLNNHYYIDRGVQPAYTAAMFFLFQDAVTRTQIALAGGVSGAVGAGLSTLRFANTVEFMELRASIPLLNVVLTLVGCGVILIIALVVAMLSARKQYSATEGGHDTYAYAPPESFARVKLDRSLFPWIVMKRRVIDFTAAPTSTATATTGASSNKNPNSQNGGGVIGAGDEGERIDAFTIGAVRLEHDHRDVAVEVPFTMGK